MPYPSSSPVQPGDATLADQYNTLRNDALYFGAAETEAATVGEMMSSYRSPLRFTAEKSAAALTLRLHANPNAPVGMMIAGSPSRITEPLTVELKRIDYPDGGTVQIIAKKIDNQVGFRLIAKRANETPGANERHLATVSLRAGSFRMDSFELADGDEIPPFPMKGTPSVCNGRLTLVSGDPTPGYDVTLAETVYFTPCGGNEIALFDSAVGWRIHEFTEISLPLSGLNANVCYDLFVTNGENALELRALPWGSLTNRSGPLTRKNGILVAESDASLRYVGTIGLFQNGKTRDTLTERNIWNLYYPISRPLAVRCGTTSNALNVAGSWGVYLRDSNLAVRAVVGLSSADLALTAVGAVQSIASGFAALGIAIDADPDDPELILNQANLSTAVNQPHPLRAEFQSRGSTRHLGKRTYTMVAYASALGTVFNGNNGTYLQLGMIGALRG